MDESLYLGNTMQKPWQATILTLFPEMFPGPLAYTLPGKAAQQGIWGLDAFNIRDFAQDKHRTVDDTPYGGGAGMVLRADILEKALLSIKEKDAEQKRKRPFYYLSPRGEVFSQKKAYDLSQEEGVILLCGRYEGVDARFLEYYDIPELSIGDYVLCGGEVASYVILEACIRLLPGVIGTEASLSEESFEGGLLEYPQYTRPSVWQGLEVPSVLTSGNHEAVRTWRHAKAQEVTQHKRPDLWQEWVKTHRKNEK